MTIIRRFHNINAESPLIENSNYLSDRIGFWALVTEQDSKTNTVTIISDTGYKYSNIPVVSDEWVTVDKNKNYIPSTRNLPPKNSRVFVLTPTHSISGAFVLCSGFSRGDENIRTLWAQNDNEMNDKNNCRETRTQGGWDIKEEYANGNFSSINSDANIKFIANTTEDSNKSQNKEVSVEAWGNKIIINEDGLKITDKNNNEIAATSSGLKITDKNGNVVESKSNEFSVAVGGASGCLVKITNEKVTVNGHLEVKVTV